MTRLDDIHQYFHQKERSRLDELVKSSPGGLPVMSKEEIRLSCLQNEGFETPELNEQLYLHFRGFKRIENLDEYTSCKAIWLESNGFEKIENLEHLPLRCLYLSKNLISKMEGLNKLSLLATLDLSNNRITNVEGLEGCKSLKTINLSRNALATPESLNGLLDCPSIDNIDVTNNRLEGDVARVLAKMPKLHALSINGNPCTQSRGFRKHTIYEISTLSYLDRPIDEIEKLGAIAYVTEGPEKEKEVRQAFVEKQKKDRSDELKNYRKWQQEQLALRKEKIAAGETEGLNLITEFTEEEKAIREKEAQEAADREKNMLDLGIGKLGQKYWQMQDREGNKNKNGVDILEEAADELRKSSVCKSVKEENAQGIETEDVSIEIIEGDNKENCCETSDSNESSEGAPEVNKSEEENNENQRADVSENESHVEIGASGSESHKHEETDNNMPDKSCDEANTSNANHGNQKGDESVSAESTVNDENQEDSDDVPQWVHQQRIQESIEIVRRQKQLEKTKFVSTQTSVQEENSVNIESFTTTQTTIDWSFEANKGNDKDSIRKIYWTEWMDLKLAELVHKHIFDFDTVANAMNEIASSDEISHHREQSIQSEMLKRITEEDCRIRWAELDSRQWSCSNEATEESFSSAPAVYKVCVQPDVLGKGHGAQPSFDAMVNMATSMPSYLKVPIKFPSMSDDDPSSEDDNLVFSSKHRHFEELD